MEKVIDIEGIDKEVKDKYEKKIEKWNEEINEMIANKYKEIYYECCMEDNLEAVKWLVENEKVDEDYNCYKDENCKECDIFEECCRKGSFRVAKYLIEELGVDIKIESDIGFYWSCVNGYLEIAKWIFGLGYIDIHSHRDTLETCCRLGHLKVAKRVNDICKFKKEDIKRVLDKMKGKIIINDECKKIIKWLRELYRGEKYIEEKIKRSK